MCTEVTVEHLLKNCFHIKKKGEKLGVRELRAISLAVTRAFKGEVYVNMTSIGLRRAISRSHGVFQLSDDEIAVRGEIDVRFLNMGYEQEITRRIQKVIRDIISQKNAGAAANPRRIGKKTAQASRRKKARSAGVAHSVC